MTNLTPEFLLAFGIAVVGVLGWLFRLEAKGNANGDKIKDNCQRLDDANERIDRIEVKHDQVYTEVRSMLFTIQKSISNIEGRLSINSKGE